jgi:hypothetical protein
MVRHIVLFALKEGITKEDGRVRKAFGELEQLDKRIATIRGWELGDNFSARPVAVDYALVSSFDTEEDLDGYIRHEAHQNIVARLKEVCTWVACDYHI